MSSKIFPLVMLLVGGVVGGGVVMLLQRDNELGELGEGVSTAPAGAPVVAVEGAGAGAGREGSPGTLEEEVVEPEVEVVEAAEGASFEDLMARVFAGEASDDEQLEFWEQLRKTDKIDGVIDSLTEQVEADAGDVPGRMTLAQLYVMKLLSVPPGPAQGLLSEKAQALWSEVLAVEPDHFEAQYSIAFSLSQYPDFLNRTDDAIAAFEKAIEIEGRTGASGGTAQAYENLARLHQKSGDPASALEVLERGVVAHPEHEGIGGQLEKLKRGFVFEEK